MKTTQGILLAALCATQAHAYTLPSKAIKAYECDNCAQLSHDSLKTQWQIPGTTLQDATHSVHKSFSYKQQVSRAQLQAGVTLATRAPGAVIRISPLYHDSVPALVLETPQKQRMSLKDASSTYTQDGHFGEAKHQTMFQIKPELGSGTFVLKSTEKNGAGADAYQIHVFDKFSPTYLHLETNALHYHYGDKLNTLITLKGMDPGYDITEINASLVNPEGHAVPLKIVKMNYNQFNATTTLHSEENPRGENWYVEVDVFAEDAGGHGFIKRSGHAALSYAIPSATLVSINKSNSNPLTFVATVKVATASRYALQSVLFQKKGLEDEPLETAQAAQWLEPGTQQIQFTFDNATQLSDDSLSLGYLRLIDYGQHKTVYEFNQPIKLTQLVE